MQLLVLHGLLPSDKAPDSLSWTTLNVMVLRPLCSTVPTGEWVIITVSTLRMLGQSVQVEVSACLCGKLLNS